MEKLFCLGPSYTLKLFLHIEMPTYKNKSQQIPFLNPYKQKSNLINFLPGYPVTQIIMSRHIAASEPTCSAGPGRRAATV